MLTVSASAKHFSSVAIGFSFNEDSRMTPLLTYYTLQVSFAAAPPTKPQKFRI